MDKLRSIEMFVRIADGGSLTAASESLGISVPTVVRSLAALEARLGAKLINRTTRRMQLTEEGREYYERARQLLADVEAAEAKLTERQMVPKGRIGITSAVTFGRWHVAPILNEFLLQHADVHIDLILLDRVVDLLEEGLDVAVRLGKLPDSSLVAMHVGDTRQVLCASPAYLAKRGVPTKPKELLQHACVHATNGAATPQWTFRVAGGLQRIAVSGPLTCNQIEAVIDACVQGVGVGRFLNYQVRDRVKRGELSYVLERHEPEPFPVHVLYAGTKLMSTRVRHVIDWLVPRLRKELA